MTTTTGDAMRYWTRPIHLRYEARKRVERLCLWIACRLPAQLRLWVVVDSTNEARRLYPDESGYAGPDGLDYRHIHDGALRARTVADADHGDARTVVTHVLDLRDALRGMSS